MHSGPGGSPRRRRNRWDSSNHCGPSEGAEERSANAPLSQCSVARACPPQPHFDPNGSGNANTLGEMRPSVRPPRRGAAGSQDGPGAQARAYASRERRGGTTSPAQVGRAPARVALGRKEHRHAPTNYEPQSAPLPAKRAPGRHRVKLCFALRASPISTRARCARTTRPAPRAQGTEARSRSTSERRSPRSSAPRRTPRSAAAAFSTSWNASTSTPSASMRSASAM